MRSFATELGLGACPGAQKKCFSSVVPEAWAVITASNMLRSASTRRPRAGRRSRVFVDFVDMTGSLGRFPKVFPKLEKVSRRPGMVSLVNAVFFVTVLPHSEKSVENCFRYKNVASRTSCAEPDVHLGGRLRTREGKYNQVNS